MKYLSRNKLLIGLLLLSIEQVYAQTPCDTAFMGRTIESYHRSQVQDENKFVRDNAMTLCLFDQKAGVQPASKSNSRFAFRGGPVFRFYLMALSKECGEVTFKIYRRYNVIIDGKTADEQVPDVLLLEFSDPTGDKRPSMGELQLEHTSDYYMTIDSGGKPACALLYVYVSYPVRTSGVSIIADGFPYTRYFVFEKI